MPEGLYIDAKALTNGAKGFDQLVKELPNLLDDVLNSNAKEIAGAAMRNAPVDRAFLKPQISADTTKFLEKHIKAPVPYAAYVEFGTGKFAAQKVSEYPAEYQTFAAQFKGGGGGGNFTEFVKLIIAWILRKGIVASYNIQTRKRVGAGKSQAEQQRAEQMGYVIARSILIKGIHPHPFLIPALIAQEPQLKTDIENLLKKLKPNV
jgi:Bacteriophage HK97-gp10, putative tail-component